MTIRELIKNHLTEIGADGLYCNEGDPCGCSIDDLDEEKKKEDWVE